MKTTDDETCIHGIIIWNYCKTCCMDPAPVRAQPQPVYRATAESIARDMAWTGGYYRDSIGADEGTEYG